MEGKNFILTLFVMLGLIGCCVYFDNECRGIRSTANIDRSRIRSLEEENRELEKKLRLLETDMYVLQHGYDEK